MLYSVVNSLMLASTITEPYEHSEIIVSGRVVLTRMCRDGNIWIVLPLCRILYSSQNIIIDAFTFDYPCGTTSVVTSNEALTLS